MEKEKLIRDYLHKETRGSLFLSYRQAKQIVHLATSFRQPYCKLYRYSETNRTWQLIRVALTTTDKLKATIQAAINKRPIENFFRWDCFNADDVFECSITSINSDLF